MSVLPEGQRLRPEEDPGTVETIWLQHVNDSREITDVVWAHQSLAVCEPEEGTMTTSL